MKKKLMISIWAVVLLAATSVVYILKQHSFDMIEEPIEITTPQGILTGILALPKSQYESLGLVLFIHGDGAINATHDEGYKPLWEQLAKQGYASLSLNKRGIEGSEGDWLNQNMDDRVEEARQAIAWAKTQTLIDSERIGVWGASQAGWVIPKLAGEERLAFSIVVSPAINWLAQGEYHTRSHMAKQGASPEQIERQIRYEQEVNERLERGASYEEYVAMSHPSEPMREERWHFVSQNFKSDAVDDLDNFDSPVLLLLGEEDLHVDVQDTEQAYRQYVDEGLLRVAVLPQTEHSMLRTATAQSELRAFLIGLFAPRHITVKGYMEEISTFIASLPSKTHDSN